MNKLINQIIKHQKTCYFVSPHLDDAAFSAGGLISYLALKTKVVIITAFTGAARDKHSLSALAYIKMCGYKSNEVGKFFFERRKEDKELFESLGAKVMHLGFLDALWRVNKNPNIVYKFLSYFINDFRYIYPTHRLHIFKGKIHKEDIPNLRRLEKKLIEIVSEDKNSVVFCPLGVGRHVDHIMAREACTNVSPQVIYWEDSPYNLYHKLDKDFIKKKGLKRKVFNKDQANRKALYSAYKTQFGKLFEGKTDFSLSPETYYIKDLQ